MVGNHLEVLREIVSTAALLQPQDLAATGRVLTALGQTLLRLGSGRGTHSGGGSHAMSDISTLVDPRKDAPAVVPMDPDLKLIDRDIDSWCTELVRLKRSPDYLRRGPGVIRELREKYRWQISRDASTRDISEWLGKEGGSAQNQNNLLSMIHVYFEHCRKVLKTVDENPAGSIQRLQVVKGQGVREFTPEEQSRIIHASTGHWRTACIIFAGSALRRGAVFRKIRCGYLDRRNRQWDIPAGVLKPKTALTIPIEDEAFEHIDQATRGRQHSAYVIPIGYDHGTWLNLLEAAHVDYEDERGRKAGTHSFRKGVASILAEHDVHLKVAKEILGHSDVRVTEKIYTRVSSKKVRSAVNFLKVVTPPGNGVCANPGGSGPDNLAKEGLTKPGTLADSHEATLMENAHHNPARTSALARGDADERGCTRAPSNDAGAFSSRVVERDPVGGPALEASRMTPRGFEPRGNPRNLVGNGVGGLPAGVTPGRAVVSTNRAGVAQPGRAPAACSGPEVAGSNPSPGTWPEPASRESGGQNPGLASRGVAVARSADTPATPPGRALSTGGHLQQLDRAAIEDASGATREVAGGAYKHGESAARPDPHTQAAGTTPHCEEGADALAVDAGLTIHDSRQEAPAPGVAHAGVLDLKAEKLSVLGRLGDHLASLNDPEGVRQVARWVAALILGLVAFGALAALCRGPAAIESAPVASQTWGPP